MGLETAGRPDGDADQEPDGSDCPPRFGVPACRTKAALAAKRARGERVGGIPYGWRLGPDQRVLEREPCEQAVIARIKALRETGTPLRTIARTLNAERAPARAGRWHLTSLARVVKREAM